MKEKTMSNENMKRRIKVNTADLKVGNLFFDTLYGDGCFEILAVGPEYYGYTPNDRRANRVHVYCSKHEDVWIDPPRTTVGEFGVGERFRSMLTHDIYTVTAVGKKYSLAMRSTGDERMIHHDSMHVQEVE